MTGGAQGIGLAVADRLLREGPVRIWDLAPGKNERFVSVKARGADFDAVDVTNAESVREAADRIPEVGILVTCAGIAGMNAPTWSCPLAEWNRMLSINLSVKFHCARTVRRRTASPPAWSSTSRVGGRPIEKGPLGSGRHRGPVKKGRSE
ncbi:SDR family oxidoreductase [Mesorhizobium sp. CN2-181]|uniref:SDR family oxidoreductase n=1 Tax=Mesorhizobium yinganensis TaxID=3157707 RepID=UPI0032B87631